jgi:hypothetical protein
MWKASCILQKRKARRGKIAILRTPSGADWEIARPGSLASELIEGGQINAYRLRRLTDSIYQPKAWAL